MMTASGPPRLNEHLTGICSLSMGQSRIKMTIVPAAGSMSVTEILRHPSDNFRLADSSVNQLEFPAFSRPG
jgi:hypothetical protein